MNLIEANLFNFLIPVLVTIGLFFLVRSILLWYWKVDEITELLKEIKRNTSANYSGGDSKFGKEDKNGPLKP